MRPGWPHVYGTFSLTASAMSAGGESGEPGFGRSGTAACRSSRSPSGRTGTAQVRRDVIGRSSGLARRSGRDPAGPQVTGARPGGEPGPAGRDLHPAKRPAWRACYTPAMPAAIRQLAAWRPGCWHGRGRVRVRWPFQVPGCARRARWRRAPGWISRRFRPGLPCPVLEAGSSAVRFWYLGGAGQGDGLDRGDMGDI